MGVGSFRVDVIDVWNGMGCEIGCDVMSRFIKEFKNICTYTRYVCINENQYLGGKLVKR